MTVEGAGHRVESEISRGRFLAVFWAAHLRDGEPGLLVSGDPEAVRRPASWESSLRVPATAPADDEPVLRVVSFRSASDSRVVIGIFDRSWPRMCPSRGAAARCVRRGRPRRRRCGSAADAMRCGPQGRGTPELAVSPDLPPPDPFEPSGTPPNAGLPVHGPVAVFLSGPPSRAQDSLCDAILDARPGLLMICTRA